MTNNTKKVVVTGGSGKAGRACVGDLIAHGYQVFNVDNVVPAEPTCPYIVADLCPATVISPQAVRQGALPGRSEWLDALCVRATALQLYREEEREKLGLRRAEGIGVIPRSPLARGKLARTWEEEPT